MEELVQNKSILTPNQKGDQTLLTNPLFCGGNLTSNNMNNIKGGMNSFYNSSFSASMANLLSSTAFISNSNSPPNIANETTSPMNNMFRTTKIPHSNSLSSIKSSQSTDSIRNNEELMHILNKLIIDLLSHLQSDETSQKIVKFKNQISVNFTDNLDNLSSIYETLNDDYKSTVGRSIRHNYENLSKWVHEVIGYCYEKDCDSIQSKHKYDLSSIKLNTAKFLEKPLELFDQEFEKLYTHTMKLIMLVNSDKELVGNNSLECLKREFFVYFVTKPHMIETIIGNLNQINFN